MVRGQRMRDWETASNLMALIANVNNTRRGKTYTAEQFNPMIERKTGNKRVLPYSAETMEAAKTFFNKMAKRK